MDSWSRHTIKSRKSAWILLLLYRYIYHKKWWLWGPPDLVFRNWVKLEHMYIIKYRTLLEGSIYQIWWSWHNSFLNYYRYNNFSWKAMWPWKLGQGHSCALHFQNFIGGSRVQGLVILAQFSFVLSCMHNFSTCINSHVTLNIRSRSFIWHPFLGL